MRSTQSGNAVIIVMVTIALFGSLIFTFTRSAQKGSGNLTGQQSKIATQGILEYARSLDTAFNRLMVKGCSENEVSFDYDVDATTGYENADAPVSKKCHIFYPEGGQAVWSAPPSGANDGSDYFFRPIRVLKVGKLKTTCTASSQICADLVMMLGQVKEKVCQDLNKKIDGLATIPVQDDGQNFENTKFTGSLSIAGTGDLDGTDVNGVMTRCTESAEGEYYFYHVLQAR